MNEQLEFDRDLDKRLNETSARVDIVGAREIFRGILATSAGDDEEAWLSLIAPDASDDIADSLRELRDRIKKSMVDDGLSVRKTDPKRLKALREELSRRDLDAFIVPKADEHQGEFIARHSERLQWLTGFSGSAGSAIVMTEKTAAIFVDGRYTLQVKKQVSGKLFERYHATEVSQEDWLASNVSAGMRIGFDPWLVTDHQRVRLVKICESAGAYFVTVSDNPIDSVWVGQPPQPITPMLAHPAKYAGQTSTKKRAQLISELQRLNLDAIVISAPDAIAWLFNIRGHDIPCTPASLGFVVIHAAGGIELFTDPHKMSPGLQDHLGNDVVVLETDALAAELGHFGTRAMRVGVDLAQAPSKIALALRSAGADVIHTSDLTAMDKACKNKAERNGTRNAHLRDGIALCQFLCWLDRVAGKGKTTEWDVGLKIDELRHNLDIHQGPSFDTIAGFGANGAIVHYRAEQKSSATLKKGSLLLVDSGGQFLDGTTDVTRTVAIGKPSKEMCDRYTRVLKGHIALSCAVYPEGTSGSQLDTLARKPLWDIGLDYEHGTGHGVGSYLSVHEGPQRISKHPSNVALRPGMVVSNEPGFYKTGGFGIRIENLVMVQSVKMPKPAERKMLNFETLTCAPYDLRLIDTSLLTSDEITWINEYHAWVKKSLSKDLDKETKTWLNSATKPIKASNRTAR